MSSSAKFRTPGAARSEGVASQEAAACKEDPRCGVGGQRPGYVGAGQEGVRVEVEKDDEAEKKTRSANQLLSLSCVLFSF